MTHAVDLVLLDIDGVLTDGAMLITPSGDELKRISFDDIDGYFQLRRAGLKLGFITGESTSFCDYVQRRFTPDYFIRGCKDKLAAFERVLSESGASEDRIAYVGDSRHDVPLLKRLKHSYAPADAPAHVRSAVTTVLTARRGQGVLLELADRIGAGTK